MSDETLERESPDINKVRQNLEALLEETKARRSRRSLQKKVTSKFDSKCWVSCGVATCPQTLFGNIMLLMSVGSLAAVTIYFKILNAVIVSGPEAQASTM